jgi:hypothetical protein
MVCSSNLAASSTRCAVALQLEMVERNSEVPIQPPKRTYAKRTHYFARNELSRQCNPKRRPVDSGVKAAACETRLSSQSLTFPQPSYPMGILI